MPLQNSVQLNDEYQSLKKRFPEFSFKASPVSKENLGRYLALEIAAAASNQEPVISPSVRPFWGPLVTLVKRALLRLWRPFSRVYLRPQHDLNQLVVTLAFHVAYLEEKTERLEQELAKQEGRRS